MTFTINSGKTLRQIRLRYIVAAAAAAVVASAVALNGTDLRGGTAQMTTSPGEMSLPQPTISREAPRDAVVYIVGSLAEKQAIERDSTFWEWFREPGSGDASASLRVIVIEPGEEESLGVLADLVPEAGIGTGYGARLALYDLR